VAPAVPGLYLARLVPRLLGVIHPALPLAEFPEAAFLYDNFVLMPIHQSIGDAEMQAILEVIGRGVASLREHIIPGCITILPQPTAQTELMDRYVPMTSQPTPRTLPVGGDGPWPGTGQIACG